MLMDQKNENIGCFVTKLTLASQTFCSAVGGQAFSKNGYDWDVSPVIAYTPTQAFEVGALLKATNILSHNSSLMNEVRIWLNSWNAVNLSRMGPL
jgi:hypothetical protein